MAVQTAPVQTIHISAKYLRAKRILDITFTLLLSPFLLLAATIIAICIKLSSEGPVFYRQKRAGQNGVEFEMLKFRSMYVNNDHLAHREKIIKYMSGQKLNEDGIPDLSYKDVHDPRITRVGRFIRKTSLDELPQFWNVLCGYMTLVGPRPPLPYEVELYNARDRLRLCGRPGLTGTWQVYGRSRVTFQNMVSMDIDYLYSQSLWLDIKLIVLTVPVMIFARGGA
jgi:lipopolysaccharide/colanic/teichoic acid biosynthesis glycosyltransferase